jgi:hypothetical protein
MLSRPAFFCTTNSRAENKCSIPTTSQPLTIPKDPILANLHERVAEWKGHHVSTLGSLHLHNQVLVHRGEITRSYIVYLLDKAILCFVEDKTGPTPNVLSLKGRIFTYHIKDVMDDNERVSGLVVNVQAGEVNGDRFTLGFRSPMERGVWKAEIRSLVAADWERSKNGQL